MTLQNLLDEARQHEVVFTIEGENLRYKAPGGYINGERLAALKQHKTALIDYLRPASEEGKALLQPFLPLIQDAHEGRLSGQVVTADGQKDMNAYICHIAAGIWYGVTLADPLLPAWLDVLERLNSRRRTLSAKHALAAAQSQTETEECLIG